jgi:hypothetical protein
MNLHRTALAAVATVLCFLQGCEDIGGPPPRIVLGESIDGVVLGDTYDRVIKLHGEPTGFSIIDGLFRGWYGLYYYTSPVNNRGALGVWVVSADLNPAIQDHVDILIVEPPYEGRTREGIGIGSTRADVLRALGPPASSMTLNSGDELESYFRSDSVECAFTYSQNTITRIALGPKHKYSH